MNYVFQIGNLTSDPSMKMSKSGTPMCTFRIAVNSGYGDRKETAFLHILCFAKTAENCERYLSKGRKVAVSGRIVTGSYEKSDGTKVYTTDIIANEVEFLSSGGGESKPKKEETVEDVVMEEFAALPDDDDTIPF